MCEKRLNFIGSQLLLLTFNWGKTRIKQQLNYFKSKDQNQKQEISTNSFKELILIVKAVKKKKIKKLNGGDMDLLKVVFFSGSSRCFVYWN